MGIGSSKDDVESAHHHWEVPMAKRGVEGVATIESFHLPVADWHGKIPETTTGKEFVCKGRPWSIKEVLADEHAEEWLSFLESRQTVLVCHQSQTSCINIQAYVPDASLAIIVEIVVNT
eukprot:TRINITY_DN1569_c0_g1_i1.p1 TRINITY_DN1569_c0_g1~~TRINITY_DN1569_c0_g1_i1.p1  ORF type:complete len:119 (+),score=7.07 TRINITY_DN1569_c0_g1_i1:159-515(+)